MWLLELFRFGFTKNSTEIRETVQAIIVARDNSESEGQIVIPNRSESEGQTVLPNRSEIDGQRELPNRSESKGKSHLKASFPLLSTSPVLSKSSTSPDPPESTTSTVPPRSPTSCLPLKLEDSSETSSSLALAETSTSHSSSIYTVSLDDSTSLVSPEASTCQSSLEDPIAAPMTYNDQQITALKEHSFFICNEMSGAPEDLSPKTPQKPDNIVIVPTLKEKEQGKKRVPCSDHKLTQRSQW
ncbi:hypothetical protein Bpfe_021592 [Biomphalaria pfeifferi]|uniref:Uncharacterized protein n=1 Tax=Biomphalaria pfeifferi TaxID=112525 RepID=A0AAD8F265_BIOPF|nr:hypothetical protein Bpfe_021592 [Biomphalaria pfeifferi]